MRSILLLLLLLGLGRLPQAHSFDVFDLVWQPVKPTTLKRDVALSRNNGLAMDMLMDRALMYGQGKTFLDEVKEALDKEPKNSTLSASYARALIVLKGSYLWNGKNAPRQFGSRHSLDTNDIAALIQTAKENSKKPWLALVAEEELSVYRGVGSISSIYNTRLQMARKSVAMERNPLTLTKLADKLVAAEAIETRPKGATRQAVTLLTQITQAYPKYWRARISLWQKYAYYPLAQDKAKANTAYQELLDTIPDDLEKTRPVQSYLKWQHFDQRD